MADPTLRPAVWMLLGAFAFATMGAITSALGPRCDWLLIALVRVVFMFTAAVIWARSAGVPLVLWKPSTLWLRSLAGSLSLVCNFFALTRLPIADVLTLTNAYPLWIVLLSAAALRRPPTGAECLGVASGVAGIVLIQHPHLAGDRLAVVVALAGSVSTALAMIGLHRLKAVDTRAVVAHFSGVASALAGGWLTLRWRVVSLAFPDHLTVVMLLAVGLTGTVGQFFLTRAYAAGVPTRVSMVALTQVVFGMIYDAVIGGRTINALSLAGSVLILAPVVWLIGRAEQGGNPGADLVDDDVSAFPTPFDEAL